MNIRRFSIRVRRTICLEQHLRRLLFVAFVVVSSFVPLSKAKAIDKNSPAIKTETPFDDNLQNYLVNFGYLPKDNPEMSNLRTDEVVKRAIGRMQEFAGLDPTGVMDQATKQLMQTKRCGLPDIKFDLRQRRRRRRYVVHSSKWQKHDLTYKVENWPRELDKARTRRVMYDAVRVWTGSSSITFTEIGESTADINIKFGSRQHGDSYPFDGPNVVLAHAFFPAPGLGGDIHFDNDEKWTDRPEDDRDGQSINLLATAAHEVGHSLGLGHSKVPDALMYPYYKSGMRNIKLTYDDILGIQKLYGVGSFGEPTSPAPVSTTTEFWAGRRENADNDDGAPFSPDAPVSIPKTTPMPHPCDTHIDAVSRLRSEIFVFKNRYYWRFDEHGNLVESPAEIERFWFGLPKNLTQIDAVYEATDKDRVKIFIGRTFYEFSANQLRGEARDIGELGLPKYVDHVDAAFVWEYNGVTYFFAGDEYWRFNEQLQTTEPGYPRKIASIWIDVPNGVDAAFTDKSGTTYFFKNEMIYKFNDYFMKVEKGYPRRIGSYWGHCLNNDEQRLVQFVNRSPRLNVFSFTWLWLFINLILLKFFNV